MPDILGDKRVVTLELAAVVAGTKYRGEFEERLRKLMVGFSAWQGTWIIFIDDFALLSAGAAEGAIDASISSNRLCAKRRVAGCWCNHPDEYRKYIERDLLWNGVFNLLWSENLPGTKAWRF